MKTERWTTSNKAVYNIGYHLIWCTKYRRKMLVDKVELRLKELLQSKAIELALNLDTMEVMPDHVHLFVRAQPIHSPHYIVQQFKGYSSFMLREEFPKVKSGLPSLWTRSYYCESVGHISETTVRQYIEEQKTV